MWKVTNVSNAHVLAVFGERVISPLLRMLIQVKEQRVSSIERTTLFHGLSTSDQELFRRLLKKQHGGQRFVGVVKRVLSRMDAAALEQLLENYIAQNNSVAMGDFELQVISVPEPVTTIFVDFFYGKFFNDEEMWQTLVGSAFSKRAFIDNFKQENPIDVCAYCDLDTVNALSNNVIEHFLPKKQFPLLSMCPYNMIPACTACNLGAQGKGSRVTGTVTSPLFAQVGDRVVFDFDSISRVVLIGPADAQLEISGYLELLQLPRRYASQHVYDHLWSRWCGFANTFLYEGARGIGRKELVDYFERLFRRTPMYFAARALVNELLNYRDM